VKISIITVCYNAESTIENTIISVLNQSYNDIEYIVIDGLSKDNTMNIVYKYNQKITHIISEKDLGMYDAINKGIKIASGEIIGILNSDDEFATKNIIELIASVFIKNSNLDSLIGDINFIQNNKIIRHYSSKNWNPNKLAYGFMPPHPSFYCRKHLYTKIGFYRTDFEIAADYELLIRFLYINQLSYFYLNTIIVNMKLGGKSTNGLASLMKINSEILYACKLNGIKSNLFKLYMKYFKKVFEFVN
jgi:glycosyltransferase involved in cell wall biosynthesis